MKTFWKIITVTFIVFFVLIIIAATAGFIFLKNFDIKKYKTQITTMATKTLGRAVDFEDIDLAVSLEKGISFHLSGLTIADDPDFSAEKFVKIKDVDVKIDILTYFLKREVNVPGISINAPEIMLLRNGQGGFNFETMAVLAPKPSDENGSGPATATAAALPAILIDSLTLKNARVTIIDRSVTPEIELAVHDLNFAINRFSLTDPFPVELTAALLSEMPNLSMDGEVQLELPAHTVGLSDMNIKLDLGSLPLAEITAFPMLKGVPLPQKMDGQVSLVIHKAEVSDKGLEGLLADSSYQNGTIIFTDVVPGISVNADKIDLKVYEITLNRTIQAKIGLTAALYQDKRNIDLGGTLTIDPATLRATFKDGIFQTDLALWPLAVMKDSLAPLVGLPLPEPMNGRLRVNIKEVSASSAGLQTLLVDAKLDDASIALKGLIPDKTLGLSKIDVAVTDFSIDRPFKIEARSACLSDTQNIGFDGTVVLDIPLQAVAVTDGKAFVDLGALPLNELSKAGFIPANMPLPTDVAGKLHIGITELAINPKGITRLRTDLNFAGGKIVFDQLVPGIALNADKIDLEVKNFAFDTPFDFNGSLAYEGKDKNISFSGKMKLDPAKQAVRMEDLEVESDLAKFDLARLKTDIASLKDVPFPEILKGRLDVSIADLTAGPAGLGELTADIRLKDGEVSMKDVAPGISFAATQINAAISDLSLNGPFDFDVGLAYLSDTPNIHTTGTGTFDLAGQTVSLTNTTVDSELAAFDMQQLRNSIAALKDASLPQTIKGQFHVDIEQATAGAKGLASLAVSGDLHDWEVALKELAVPVKGSGIAFTLTEKNFNVSPVTVNLGTGTVKATVAVKDYMADRDFAVTADLENIDLAGILDQTNAPVKIEGRVTGHFSSTGKASDLDSITGDGDLSLAGAKLKDFNIMRTVLNGIPLVSQFSSVIIAALPDTYKAKFEAADTEITSATAKFGVAGQKLTADPVMVESTDFAFEGKGAVSFDQTYNIDGDFKFSSEISSAMAKGAEQLQNLYDDSGRVSLPVNIMGQGAQPPRLSVKETVVDVGKQYLKNEGKNQLNKVLHKVLGVDDEDPSASSEEDSSTTTDDPATQIIDGILDKIFK